MTCGDAGVGAATRAQRPDQKPDAAPPRQAQAQAEQQEIQTPRPRRRRRDVAASRRPADFPIQFQNDFLKAQGSRVWVPIILTLDPAKTPSGALTLYLRVDAARHDRAARRRRRRRADKNAKDNKDKDKKKDQKAPAAPPPAAPSYPFEDVSFLDVKPAAPGQPLRIQRGIGVPAGSYDLYIVLHERPAAGAPRRRRRPRPPAPAVAGKTSVLKQPLDVPNYAAGEFSTSTVILAERVDQLPTPITPDAAVGAPVRVRADRDRRRARTASSRSRRS